MFLKLKPVTSVYPREPLSFRRVMRAVALGLGFVLLAAGLLAGWAGTLWLIWRVGGQPPRTELGAIGGLAVMIGVAALSITAITHWRDKERREAVREYQKRLICYGGFGTERYFAETYNWQFAASLDGIDDRELEAEINRLVAIGLKEGPVLDKWVQALWKTAGEAMARDLEERVKRRMATDQ